MSDKVKKTKLKYNNKTLLAPKWFESVKHFEFIAQISLDECITRLAKERTISPNGLWKHNSGREFTIRVGIQRHGDSLASFRMKTTKYRSTSALQGVFEVLNDGSTAVRGELIHEFDYETLFSLIVLAVWICLVPQHFLNWLLVPFAIVAIWFQRWGKSQHPNVKYLESLLGHSED